MWRKSTPKNGNASGAAKTQSVFNKELSSICVLLETHVEEAREWAGNIDLRAKNVRKACLSFPSKTAIGLDQHAFSDIAFGLFG